MQAKNSIWHKAKPWIKADYLISHKHAEEWYLNNIFTLMALSKEDEYLKNVVTEKVQAQFDLHSQATRIAALQPTSVFVANI